jgi:hypothetical protein
MFWAIFYFFQPIVRLEVLKIYFAISSVVAHWFDIESQKNDLEAGRRGGKRRMYIDRGTRECVSIFIASVTSCKTTAHPFAWKYFHYVFADFFLGIHPTTPSRRQGNGRPTLADRLPGGRAVQYI